MKALADYVKSKGMKLGLYGDIGTSTCGGFIGFNVSATPDPVQDSKLAADVETMMSWGMASLKVDGCNADTKVSGAFTLNRVPYACVSDCFREKLKSPLKRWKRASVPLRGTFSEQSILSRRRDSVCHVHLFG